MRILVLCSKALKKAYQLTVHVCKDCEKSLLVKMKLKQDWKVHDSADELPDQLSLEGCLFDQPSPKE